MAVYYSIDETQSDLITRVNSSLSNASPKYYLQPYVAQSFNIELSNHMLYYMNGTAVGNTSTAMTSSVIQFKVSEKAGERACVLRVPCQVWGKQILTNDVQYYYVPLGTSSDAITVEMNYPNHISTGSVTTTFASSIRYSNGYTLTYSNVLASSTAQNRQSLNDAINPIATASLTNALEIINSSVSLFNPSIGSNDLVCGFYLHNNAAYFSAHTYNAIGLKLFEWGDTDGVIKYLRDGDDSGSIDPFDPNNPSTVTVTDFNTNFDAYVTVGEPAQPYAGFTNIHWSVRALNEQYNEARDVLAGMYSLDTVSTGYPWTYYKRTQAQVPVASFTKATPNNPENYNTFQFFFTEYGTPDGTQNQHSGIFMIDYAYKEGSRSKCKIRQVKFKTGDPFTADWQHEGVELTRVNIGTDAYKYTASTGETLTIYFRGITLEDLNKTDDGYKENPDTEASPTEGDISVVSGSGLNTFSISKAQFSLINKALWSTDWTQVFKSSTIDPIKCVIACKGIKFANAGSGDVPIIIANRGTDVSSGVVNPVKSYTIDNCYIPAVRGDFTDISLMRVRCYLPYIGWVDLPSAEVVGRLAYNGVQAVNKRLTFKYVVDFIDGACRCIVSVNGTERWMFDGNCAVDIPVTSDNHTNAIGTAIKSGLATTLSIATGVAGAISGNAGAVAGGVVGAVNNAPNMLPTYEYSASASPSGYINGSCNSHIMIVCEVPNVQIPNGFARKVGRPCERNLSLGSLVGFTQCKNANVSGINATTEELTMIAQALNSGVYL